MNLKASDIILFNLKKLVTLVSLFIKRINTYYSDYSNTLVLFVLLLYL